MWRKTGRSGCGERIERTRLVDKSTGVLICKDMLCPPIHAEVSMSILNGMLSTSTIKSLANVKDISNLQSGMVLNYMYALIRIVFTTLFISGAPRGFSSIW